MEITREILETDILIVGAGPAGLGLAYHLAKLVESDDSISMPEIVMIEKGSHVGAHCLSGAVMDPRGLRELIPDFKERGAPLEADVSADSLRYLRVGGAIRFPFTPPSLRNHGCHVVSLNKLAGWLGEQVEAVGVDIFTGMSGYDLLVDNGRVIGVQLVDGGRDKEGAPKSNYEPGSIIKAKVTILCEGVHGSLTRYAFEKIPELTQGRLPQSYLSGVKEVWEVTPGKIRPGEVIHTIGWPQNSKEYGGGWVYGMGENKVSIGFTVGLNPGDPTNDAHGRFQLYKTHPMIKKLLDGGTMDHYGAKAIPVAGYYAIPRLYHEGLMLCGDSAGFLNPVRLKGIHLAIKSGMMAAETLLDAIKSNDYSEEVLSGYQQRYEKSWAHTEMYRSRNFHAGFKGGLLPGLIHGALQIITGGRGLFDRREHGRDHTYMKTIAEYQRKFGRAPMAPETKFDNQFLFDKVTDVYKSGTMHEEDQPSHLVIADFDICNDRCTEEYGNPCQHFCPAHVYEMVDDSDRPGKKRLLLTPSNCVHCKTCDIADPYQVIRWVPPQGGEGPNYANL